MTGLIGGVIIMLCCLVAGLVVGLLWGVLEGGPSMWLGAAAGLARFGADPTDPVGALVAGLGVYVVAALLGAAIRR